MTNRSADDVHRALYAIARRLLPGKRAGDTLQPTAVAHEAWIRLENARSSWVNAEHLPALVAQTVRSVLVDHARQRSAAKRGGGRLRISFVPGDHAARGDVDVTDLLALDEALREFAEKHERAARVVELRFFGGLTVVEAGTALGIAPSTVDDDWRYARAWLHRALTR